MINIIGYLGFKSDCIYLHFLNGNKSLQKMILGLKPDEEKHYTFVSIEPKTGVLLRASKRLQFNINVEPMDGKKRFTKCQGGLHTNNVD